MLSFLSVNGLSILFRLTIFIEKLYLHVAITFISYKFTKQINLNYDARKGRKNVLINPLHKNKLGNAQIIRL